MKGLCKALLPAVMLAGLALLITFTVGIPVGIYAAIARGTFLDPLTICFWLLLDAIPAFVWAPWLQYVFALRLGWVDLGYEGLRSPNMVLPVLIISLPGVAGVARSTRASVIGVMNEDYVRTARMKGLPEPTVVLVQRTAKVRKWRGTLPGETS